tara:strand:- start:153 stop:449 length:297 start_codon:yes stop_codon:yes gene_type:complete
VGLQILKQVENSIPCFPGRTVKVPTDDRLHVDIIKSPLEKIDQLINLLDTPLSRTGIKVNINDAKIRAVQPNLCVHEAFTTERLVVKGLVVFSLNGMA